LRRGRKVIKSTAAVYELRNYAKTENEKFFLEGIEIFFF
jgi:hypothetical protein